MLKGTVVLAPVPAAEGCFAVRNHFMVVLAADEAGVYAVYVTSLKEGLEGGTYAFSDQERTLARFSKPCRFVPDRVVYYPRSELGHLRQTGGRLNERSLERVVNAVARVRPRPQRFHSEVMALAS
jgi:hypothetical protein